MRLGPYVIDAMLGVGGMGEVYRARDSRLNRDVAIKVLRGSVASDPDRIARLRREARTLAALNHPHIAAIYGLEDVDGTAGLILELVDGPTLADRLRRGPLPVSEALSIAAQIADAVAAAHDRGIIHRDLKPANIKLTATGSVKVLDFGIAKAFDQPSTPDEPNVTMSAPAATAAGLVVGSPAYMSPEQARGDVLDKRTDIWSFGVVLYELLSGERPFAGHTTTDTLAAVLKEEPDWNRVPEGARRLLRQCLEKDPRRRLRDIGDATALLDLTAQPGSLSATPRFKYWLWPALASLLLIAIAILDITRRPPTVPAPHPVRLQIPPANAVSADAPIVSPDGRNVVFFSRMSDSQARTRLLLYSLESGESRELFQTERTSSLPFWSSDSRSIAFVADGKLQRLDIAGGAPHTITETSGPVTGTWNGDVIVFSSNVLMRVAASGGTPVRLTAIDPSRGEIGHYLPVFLRDGRRFLYLRVSPTSDRSGIYVGTLDAKPEEQDTTRLVATRSGPIYAKSPDGQTDHLLFLQDDTLMAQPFDPARATLAGEPVRVAEQVAFAAVPSSRYAYASISDTGLLAYRHREALEGVLVWVDRQGREAGPAIQERLAHPENPRLSPDGKRVAVVRSGDLWVYDLAGRPPIKLTFDRNNDIPLWTPDGRRLVYATNAPPTRLLSVSAENSGETPQPASPVGHYHAHAWSAEGRELIAVINSYLPTNWDIVTLPVGGSDPKPIHRTTAVEGITGVALSNDGRWLAYTSNVTGNVEVWVQPYPGPGAAVRVSPHGGNDPVWAKNGRELYYLEGRKMMALSFGAGPTFEFTRPVMLFTSQYLHPAGSPLTYDVAADGRFLMLKRVDTNTGPTPINVMLNWAAGLRR